MHDRRPQNYYDYSTSGLKETRCKALRGNVFFVIFSFPF